MTDDFLTRDIQKRLGSVARPGAILPGEEFETAVVVDTHERVLTRLFKFLVDHSDEWVLCPDVLDPATLIRYDRDNVTHFTWTHPSKGTLNVYVLVEIDIHGRRWFKFVEANPV
ncbi:hypothetical protein SEA_VANLEE_49 [Gordonia phage VanLee]|uniref:Uncharacterized protein n=1 Tax=Gordonia phage VanLee TaxID=2845816 RepID=A0A8F2DAA4_9CAUD|nr:hypothetical protein QEH49_gp049 [Gordonia phage VanLee]QWS68166.1 hypothetical protein SEA_VANLEE_49 [Gordonia phage VanLee]